MPNLIEVEQELVEAFDRMSTDEMVPLDSLELFRERVLAAAEKRESVWLFLSFVESMEAETKARRDALDARIKAIHGARERLEGYILGVLKSAGITSAAGATVKFTVAESSSVHVESVDMLPDELCRVKREADKTSIALALKAGESVPGCSIRTNESLRVRPLAAKDRPGDTVYRNKEAIQ